MSRNGSGTWSAPSGTFNPAVSGATPTAADWTAFLADLTTAMSASIANDGQSTCSALIPFAVGLSTNAGVKFPGTQVAVADVNTLDDYEEGTFTPAIAFGGAAVGVTYASQVGFYTKIGNRVLFNFYIELTSNGSSVGTFSFSGLPFTAKNTTNAYAPFSIYGAGLSGMSGSLQGYVTPNATAIVVTYLGTGSVSGLDDTKVSDTASFIVGGQYMT